MKLQLEDLQVKSFVTALSRRKGQTAKGGVTAAGPCSQQYCGTEDCFETIHTCPDGPGGSNFPCATVHEACYGNTESPCSGPITFCNC
jgi:hypothetical protein